MRSLCASIYFRHWRVASRHQVPLVKSEAMASLSASFSSPIFLQNGPSNVRPLRRSGTPHLAERQIRSVAVYATQTDASAAVDVIKRATRSGTSRPSPSQIAAAMETLEKLKLKPEGTEWLEAIGGKASPGKRWQLVFTKGKNKSSGSFFPLSACQRWDASAGTIENGVYLGGILALIFKGPFVFEGKVLRFDFSKVGLRLGPIKLAFNIKPEANDVVEKIIAGGAPPSVKRELPFFKMIYIDDEIVVARGRSGGLAFWKRAEPEWELQNRIEGVEA